MADRWTIYVCKCGDNYDSTPFACMHCGPAREVKVCAVADIQAMLRKHYSLTPSSQARATLVVIAQELALGDP